MTIHDSHPFRPPEGDRDPVRRMRGRLAAPVTLWATGVGRSRTGWTVSSMLLADGDPARVIGLLDPDSDLADALGDGATFTVSVLARGQEFLAGAFAGLEPAPGGPFTLGQWSDTPHGPVLAGTAGWIGARLVEAPERRVGWGLLVDAVVERVELGDAQPLVHHRGTFALIEPGRDR